MYKERLAENLKQLIGNNSVYQVAKAIGMQQKQLSRYINAEQEIGLGNLVKIADYFNESIDILIGRREY